MVCSCQYLCCEPPKLHVICDECREKVNFVIQNKWNDINQVLPPHDGTPFLGYDPKQSNNFTNALIYVLRFEAATNFSDEGYIEAGGECYFKWQPTHWMTLPKSPYV